MYDIYKYNDTHTQTVNSKKRSKSNKLKKLKTYILNEVKSNIRKIVKLKLYIVIINTYRECLLTLTTIIYIVLLFKNLQITNVNI